MTTPIPTSCPITNQDTGQDNEDKATQIMPQDSTQDAGKAAGPTSSTRHTVDETETEMAHAGTIDGNTDCAVRPQITTQDSNQDSGQVTSTPAPSDPVVDRGPPARDPLKVTVKKRLEAEGRWKDIEPERDEMMVLARKRFRSKAERQDWVYSELDRLYPPAETSETEKGAISLTPDEASSSEKRTKRSNRTVSAEQGNTTGRTDPDSVLLDKDVRNSPVNKDDGQIQGLGAIPDEWPELPANASLALDVGWVQANRLRIIEDRPMGPTLVHLERALSPAPSWAALGWLETSIRSYAKYVDVASRAASSDSGEADVVKRERMAIEDVSTLLDEMRGEG